MFKTILVGYDGSESAERAFKIALGLARDHAARIVVLAVARPAEPAADVELEAVLEQGERYYNKCFEALKQQAEGTSATFEVVVGHPAEYLVDYACRIKADLIVVGHHGRSGIQRWLMGSVADRVADHAPCPVLVVPLAQPPARSASASC